VAVTLGVMAAFAAAKPHAVTISLLPTPESQAGGVASDGRVPIRGITPSALHQRLPLFLGSPADMAELMSYGDVQQLGAKTYAV
jgi:hypothetical protein